MHIGKKIFKHITFLGSLEQQKSVDYVPFFHTKNVHKKCNSRVKNTSLTTFSPPERQVKLSQTTKNMIRLRRKAELLERFFKNITPRKRHPNHIFSLSSLIFHHNPTLFLIFPTNLPTIHSLPHREGSGESLVLHTILVAYYTALL